AKAKAMCASPWPVSGSMPWVGRWWYSKVPAMSYLDILRDVADRSTVPVAAYQISGEYAMITAAAERGWIDRRASVLESLIGIRRAGADIVLTYWATEAAHWLS
ncbi:hypothetical protein ACWDNU_46060, partial [Amycolatopsis sp. NPDC003676]